MFSFYPLSIPIETAQTATNNNYWLWIFIFIVVVIVVWWLLIQATAHSGEGIDAHGDEHGHDAHKQEEEELESAPELEASVTSTEPGSAAEPDDLGILEGIGPKVKELLADAGIVTFAQLAGAEVGKLEEILKTNKLQFLDPASWPEQAQLAAEGKMDELQQLMDNLKGGRKAD